MSPQAEPPIDFNDLSINARQIASCVGILKASRLIRRFGGLRLYVKASLTHREAAAFFDHQIPTEDAINLVEMYRHDIIHFPRSLVSYGSGLRRSVLKMKEQGYKNSQIAEILVVHERSIRKSRLKPACDLPSLFDKLPDSVR